MDALEVTVTVRRKNQVTVPEAITEQLGIQPGDRLVLWIDQDPEGERGFRARALPRSYAGALRGVYGTPDQAAEYLAGERVGWDEE